MNGAALLSEFGNWMWWIIAVVFGILELVVPGIFFIWLAAAALGVGLITLVVEISLAWQAAIFAVLSVLAVWASRRFLIKHPITSDQPLLNQRAQAYIGRVFSLEHPIENGRGKLRVGDTLWLASGPELPAGAQVKVIGTDGSILLVEAA